MEGGKNLTGKPKITMLDVWEGRAHHTAGGLTKTDLMINKKNRVVSRRKHELGIRNFTGFRAKLCDGDFDISKFKPTYSAKYIPKKKKPPARDTATESRQSLSQSTKERIQKMISVRKTEDEMADAYKRFQITLTKSRAGQKKNLEKVETPRKLTKEEWVEQQIDLIPKNADKWKAFNALKKGDKVSLSYMEEEHFITGVVATNPIVRIRLAGEIEPAVKINIKTIDGEKPTEYQLKQWKKGLSMDLIDKISICR